MTRVKLCGLRDEAAVKTVNRLKPDYAGFICSKPFRRYVERDILRHLNEMLDPEIKAVGVFVNEPIETVVSCVKETGIDAVQLHGKEDNAYIRSLKERISCPVFQAVKLRSAEDAERANCSAADLLVADGGTGEGKTFDWSLLGHLRRDYLLAGGLNPGNAEEAVRQIHPYGVDTSSGIETDGKKDPVKMEQFVYAVRRADNDK